jgi:kumamolisin
MKTKDEPQPQFAVPSNYHQNTLSSNGLTPMASKRGCCVGLTLALTVMMALFSRFASAQDSAQSNIIVPPSTAGSVPGVVVRTHLFISKPDDGFPPGAYPINAETPGSLACIYGVTLPTPGCPRGFASPPATGGDNAIAVVVYGHNPTLQSDFNFFNAFFAMPTQNIQFICDCGSCPNSSGTGWDIEAALDVEYSHAMAPNAQIVVSEFCSDPFAGGINGAEYLAGNRLLQWGAGEVSNSFGYVGGEFPAELGYDKYMTTPGVVYFSAAGDSGLGTDYPSVSPNSISAGGTTIIRDPAGNYKGEQDCWSGSGGGISTYEPLPSYQLIIGGKIGPHRGTPDYAADADPNTGVAVFNMTSCGGWCEVGGTSVSSPVLAGVVNAAGSFVKSTSGELGKSYNSYLFPLLYHTYFYDVTKGSNNAPAGVGWDECTGLGAPQNLLGF